MSKKGRRDFGSIRKRASGRWQASYPAHGRRVPLGTFLTKSDANAALAAQQVELARGTWIDPRGRNIRFGDWANEWKATTIDLRLSTKVRDFGYLDRYMLPHFRDVPLGDITYMRICNWIAALSSGEANAGKPLAPATVVKASR